MQVHAAEVRDVMLPGELRKAFSEVLKAKQEGQAALERARGERQARKRLLQTRSGKCIAAGAAISRAAQPRQRGAPQEGQPALATLRFLQTLEASNAGQTFVMNDLSALLPSLSSRGAKPSTPEPGET